MKEKNKQIQVQKISNKLEIINKSKEPKTGCLKKLIS